MTGTAGAGRVVRTVLLLGFAVFFALPLVALADFSTTVPATGERSARAWQGLLADPTMTGAIRTSLLLAGLTVVLMVVLLVPTMIWVRLRVPRATRLVELLCLLPLAIPALVVVVGLRTVYAWVTYLLGDSALTLSLVYVVLVLPYAYRAIDGALSSVDAVVLSEAARSLGAGWATVVVRVVTPVIWPGVLGAAFICVALVLGEYTVASLQNYVTLPVAIVLLGKSDAPQSMAASLASILLAALLLVLLSFVDRRRASRRTS